MASRSPAATRVRWLLARTPQALAAALALVLALPLGALVLGALAQVGRPPPRGLALLVPWPPSLEGFARALSLVPLARALLLSALLGGLAVPLAVGSAAGAGFALALSGPRARALLSAALLLLATVPPSALWLPRFLLFREAGLVGTWVPVLAPALLGGSPLLVLLFTAAFRRLPREQFEAAQLEGVGALRAWWRLALPQVRATTAAAALLAFTLFFGAFVEPLLFLDPRTTPTAPLTLRDLQLLGSTQWPVLMAGATLVALPALLAFTLAQRPLLSPRAGR